MAPVALRSKSLIFLGSWVLMISGLLILIMYRGTASNHHRALFWFSSFDELSIIISHRRMTTSDEKHSVYIDDRASSKYHSIGIDSDFK